MKNTTKEKLVRWLLAFIHSDYVLVSEKELRLLAKDYRLGFDRGFARGHYEGSCTPPPELHEDPFDNWAKQYEIDRIEAGCQPQDPCQVRERDRELLDL